MPKHPPDSKNIKKKNSKEQGHFFGACVYHAAKSSDFNTDTPLVSACKRTAWVKHLRGSKKREGCTLPQIKKRLGKKLQVANSEYPTIITLKKRWIAVKLVNSHGYGISTTGITKKKAMTMSNHPSGPPSCPLDARNLARSSCWFSCILEV